MKQKIELKCPDHPEETRFIKVTQIWTTVSVFGNPIHPLNRHNGDYQKPEKLVTYICRECDDIIRKEPILEMKGGVTGAVWTPVEEELSELASRMDRQWVRCAVSDQGEC